MSISSVEIDAPSLRLLVIEDEALVAMLIEDALTLHGHAVVGVADSATAAIEMAEREQPDMALCDVRLTDGFTGTRVAEMLAARGVPCLYLSANCPGESEHPLVLGCLPKPFHTGSIGKAVRAAHAAVRGERPRELPAGMTLYHG
jgi:two-component system, response regulator PdtaR